MLTLLVVQLLMTQQTEEEQRDCWLKGSSVYENVQKYCVSWGRMNGVEAMEDQEGGMGVFLWGATAATTAETYQNSSYILAQSVSLPED